MQDVRDGTARALVTEKRRVRWMLGLIWLGGGMLAALLFVMSMHRPSDRPILKITGIDSVTYYAVSRSLLFDRDVDLRNEFAVLRPDESVWNATVPRTGLPSAPFPIGFSLVQLPWLAGASLIDAVRGHPAAGFSSTCIAAWYLGIIALACLGLCTLFLWLRDLGTFLSMQGARRDLLAFGAALAVWPSTTLGYYTFSSMAHVAAFAATSLFLLTWFRARDRLDVRPWVGVGAAAAAATLCRWQEALLLVIPMLWDIGLLRRQPSMAPARVRAWVSSRMAAAGVFALCMVPQLLEWKQVYGTWLTVPQGEGFLGFPPSFLLEVFLSSRNGWFVWTPITLIGVAGLLLGLRRSPALFAILLAALLAEVVLIAGMRNWHGYGFGLRYLTSLVTFVAAGLLCIACSVRRWGSAVLATAVIGCTVVTLLFAVQYRLDLIPRDVRLTAGELVWDKLQLGRAYLRQALAREAERALEQGDPGRALELSERACREVGVSAKLLEIRVAASEKLPDPAALTRARHDQQRYEAARLF